MYQFGGTVATTCFLLHPTTAEKVSTTANSGPPGPRIPRSPKGSKGFKGCEANENLNQPALFGNVITLILQIASIRFASMTDASFQVIRTCLQAFPMHSSVSFNIATSLNSSKISVKDGDGVRRSGGPKRISGV